jgi:hypothetical protein
LVTRFKAFVVYPPYKCRRALLRNIDLSTVILTFSPALRYFLAYPNSLSLSFSPSSLEALDSNNPVR